VGFQVLHQSLENADRFGRDSDHLIGFRTQCCTLGTGASVIVVQLQQFALLRVAGLFDDCRFQRRVMVLRVVLLQDVLDVVRDLVDLQREKQRLCLESISPGPRHPPVCTPCRR
jgi:hypothetical protein